MSLSAPDPTRVLRYPARSHTRAHAWAKIIRPRSELAASITALASILVQWQAEEWQRHRQAQRKTAAR